MIVKSNSSCVAIGNFDGIHIGHDRLIKKMIELSHEKNRQSIIITFRYIKKELRKSDYNLKYINNFDTRLELLKSYHVDHVYEIELDEIISKYSPEQFIKEILVEKFNAKDIVVGYNFTFGHKAMGNVSTLKELQMKYGYQVEEIPPVKYKGVVVSSSLVRELIKEGKISDANSLMVQSYRIYCNDIYIDYDKNTGFADNKENIIIPSDGKYRVMVGNQEVFLSIATGRNGRVFTFDRKIEKNKDIIFME